MPLSLIAAAIAFPVACLVCYFVGVHAIGVPMAKFSWRFWTQRPEMKPGIRSYLLYPLVHSLHDGKPFSQARFLVHDFTDSEEDAISPYRPSIWTYLYTYRNCCSSGYHMLSWDDDDRDSYLHHAAWLWLPRLIVLVPLHAWAATHHMAAALHWLAFAR